MYLCIQMPSWRGARKGGWKTDITGYLYLERWSLKHRVSKWFLWTKVYSRLDLNYFSPCYSAVGSSHSSSIYLKLPVFLFTHLLEEYITTSSKYMIVSTLQPHHTYMTVSSRVFGQFTHLKASGLHSKGNYKQGEKTALRLGENNSK